MPFCRVGHYQNAGDAGGNNGIGIYYRTYGHGPIKVLLIIGLAGTHDSWGPQIRGLTGTETPNDDDDSGADGRGPGEDGDGGCNGAIEVCAFDNRGMGQSFVPTKKSEYTTKIMAKDAIALMDHLGWRKAHIFGHSMGAMIACKLAAIVPDRVLSLALLNVTGGGFECFPKVLCLCRKLMGFHLDVQEYLEEFIGPNTRRDILYQDLKDDKLPFLSLAVACLQSSCGSSLWVNKRLSWDDNLGLSTYVGALLRLIDIIIAQLIVGGDHVAMCILNSLETRCLINIIIAQLIVGSDHVALRILNSLETRLMQEYVKELELIRTAGFLISVIHGRYDIIAQICHARRLAEKLQPCAKMIELHGGHLVSHERTEEVNQALLELINASETKISPHDWTNLTKETSGKDY
ncbi:hypothetical protein CK203_029405 [Vitis vinifera]|uniref:AB hydrolase-1 domain-containing protein n=1 Tax=Vitis vinifera TaxID=29760 RepID=A0A438HWZ3_VITVI|nr:hypothetical protein CK203_029405 [Vitis vinifera]